MNIKKLKHHKKIIENFSYLSVLQILSMITPLITYPYLVKTLGEVIYGTVVFVQAVVTYFNILVIFGFNFTAAKGDNRDNPKKLNEIITTVTIIKILFLIFSLFLMTAYTFSKMDHTYIIYLFGYVSMRFSFIIGFFK